MKKNIDSLLITLIMIISVFASPLSTSKAFAAVKKPGEATVKSIAINSKNQPVLKWAAVDGVTGYRVYRKTVNDAKWVKVASTKKTKFTDTKINAEEGTIVQYKLKVYVKDSAGNVTWGSYGKVKKVTLPMTKKTQISYPIAVDKKNFPDDKFRKYISDKFGSSLSEEEALSVIEMDFSFKEITSLQGIEFFPALTDLDCRYCLLTSLDMSKNKKLINLLCPANQLTNLNVSGCSSIKRIDCGGNFLTSLDVSKNIALERLSCDNNRLNSLNVSSNISLTELDCCENQLLSLDVSKNTMLTNLSCGHNKLTNLDVSYNAALTRLYCKSNKITCLNVSKNPALFYLECDWNQIAKLDLSKNPALKYLICDYELIIISNNPDLQINPW